jgi:hypothetical protein
MASSFASVVSGCPVFFELALGVPDCAGRWWTVRAVGGCAGDALSVCGCVVDAVRAASNWATVCCFVSRSDPNEEPVNVDSSDSDVNRQQNDQRNQQPVEDWSA